MSILVDELVSFDEVDDRTVAFLSTELIGDVESEEEVGRQGLAVTVIILSSSSDMMSARYLLHYKTA